MAKEVKVMGVKFDSVTQKEALDKMFFLLRDGKQHQIVTPNPEILLIARKDEKYRQILNRSSLSIPDGNGVLWAASLGEKKSFLNGLWKGFLMIFVPKKSLCPLPERVTGTDLMDDFLNKILKDNLAYKVFLLGSKDGAGKEVMEKFSSCVVGAYEGSPAIEENDKILKIINHASPDVLFVAYGSPAQEKWIYRNLKKMPSVKVAIGVGGAFDFISEKVSRAPKVLRKFRVEWLWRLLMEPKRIKRIWNAVFVFPYVLLIRKIRINLVK